MEDNSHLKSTESVFQNSNGVHTENSIKSTTVTNNGENKSLENEIQTVNCYW